MPRTTSQVTDTEFPFAEDTTPFILVINDGGRIEEAEDVGLSLKDGERGYVAGWTVAKKLEMVETAIRLEGGNVPCSLLAVWPGATASHVFLVDDLNEARDALG